MKESPHSEKKAQNVQNCPSHRPGFTFKERTEASERLLLFSVIVFYEARTSCLSLNNSTSCISS